MRIRIICLFVSLSISVVNADLSAENENTQKLIASSNIFPAKNSRRKSETFMNFEGVNIHFGDVVQSLLGQLSNSGTSANSENEPAVQARIPPHDTTYATTTYAEDITHAEQMPRKVDQSHLHSEQKSFTDLTLRIATNDNTDEEQMPRKYPKYNTAEEQMLTIASKDKTFVQRIPRITTKDVIYAEQIPRIATIDKTVKEQIVRIAPKYNAAKGQMVRMASTADAEQTLRIASKDKTFAEQMFRLVPRDKTEADQMLRLVPKDKIEAEQTLRIAPKDKTFAEQMLRLVPKDKAEQMHEVVPKDKTNKNQMLKLIPKGKTEAEHIHRKAKLAKDKIKLEPLISIATTVKTNTADDFRWVPASLSNFKHLASKAVVAGRSSINGSPIWVIRCSYYNNKKSYMIPGNLLTNELKASFSKDGKEYVAENFEVLTAPKEAYYWKRWSVKEIQIRGIPYGALIASWGNVEPMPYAYYVGRVLEDDMETAHRFHVGSISSNWLHFGFRGKQIYKEKFDVLMRKNMI